MALCFRSFILVGWFEFLGHGEVEHHVQAELFPHGRQEAETVF